MASNSGVAFSLLFSIVKAMHMKIIICSTHMHKIYTYMYEANMYTSVSKSIFTLHLHANSVRISILKVTHTYYRPVVFWHQTFLLPNE